MNDKIKVLYIEHVAGDSLVADNILKKAGIASNILAVNNKQAFITALTNFVPDIVLSDDSLTGLNTINALTIIKQTALSIPLITVTDFPLTKYADSIVSIMKQGACDYVFKDNISTLPDAVVSAIKKHQTEEKLLLGDKHENALKRSEANLSAIIENTSDLVYSLDINLRFITFNQLFKNVMKSVYGFHIEQGIGILSLIIDFDQAMAAKWKDIYAKALAGETLQFVNEYPIPEGKVFLSYSINPIREGGKVIGLSCFSRDITQQKLMEIERERITEDLLQRNKALEQFTYIISHNLRAPLANIIGLTGLAESMEIKNDEVSAIINNVGRSANKLDEVISDLNQVLQVNKALNESIELILLPQLIENIELSIKHLIEQDHVSIICNFEECREMHSLKSFIHSIFYNLIQNSIKYRKPDISPVINISTKVHDGKMNIVYKDNGRGIDTSKYANELFGLYKRFDTSVEGKGMGLFMVKMQVESLGGKITLTSELTKGTEFLLEFPQLQKQFIDLSDITART